MPRVTTAGTFVFVRGNMILDGWQIDCEGGEVLTQEEVMKLVLQFLYATIVEAPEQATKRAAQEAIDRMKRAPDA